MKKHALKFPKSISSMMNSASNDLLNCDARDGRRWKCPLAIVTQDENFFYSKTLRRNLNAQFPC